MHVSRFSQFNLFLLIALLHLSGLWGIWRAQAALTPPVAPPQQVITAMLIAPEPKPEPPPPKPEPVKPVVKPPKPVKPKPALKPTPERAITEKTVRLNTPPEVEEVAEAKPTPVKTAPVLPQKTAVSAAKTAQPHPQTAPVKTTAPQFNAAYLNNPAPEYPSSARRMGETGRVILRVQVTANGVPSQVLIHSSSGVDSLDEAALEAVQRWKFVPAKQGETPVAAWVNVPIQFTLN
ncbi:MAG: energy transducer TonB [Thiotrichaceae bacterium]|nr:energy transducer TonB [Thiotrichaceae bacterium]